MLLPSVAFDAIRAFDLLFQTMAEYVEEIPEPSFVQDFLDGTCCCVIVLCSLISLNWTHLVGGTVNRKTDSQPIDRFAFFGED